MNSAKSAFSRMNKASHVVLLFVIFIANVIALIVPLLIILLNGVIDEAEVPGVMTIITSALAVSVLIINNRTLLSGPSWTANSIGTLTMVGLCIYIVLPIVRYSALLIFGLIIVIQSFSPNDSHFTKKILVFINHYDQSCGISCRKYLSSYDLNGVIVHQNNHPERKCEIDIVYFKRTGPSDPCTKSTRPEYDNTSFDICVAKKPEESCNTRKLVFREQRNDVNLFGSIENTIIFTNSDEQVIGRYSEFLFYHDIVPSALQLFASPAVLIRGMTMRWL